MADTTISPSNDLSTEPVAGNGLAIIRSLTDVRNMGYVTFKGFMRAGLASATDLTALSGTVTTFMGTVSGYAARLLPSGGADGQVLKKTSSSDYQTAWEDESGGGGGAVDSIVAGTGVTIEPTSGTGDVTINATGGGGSSTFIGDTDTPMSYAQPGSTLQVNTLGLGLEFVAPSGGTTFTPSQENIYDAVAEIITGNITEDATAHTIDVLAAGAGLNEAEVDERVEELVEPYALLMVDPLTPIPPSRVNSATVYDAVKAILEGSGAAVVVPADASQRLIINVPDSGQSGGGTGGQVEISVHNEATPPGAVGEYAIIGTAFTQAPSPEVAQRRTQSLVNSGIVRDFDVFSVNDQEYMLAVSDDSNTTHVWAVYDRANWVGYENTLAVGNDDPTGVALVSATQLVILDADRTFRFYTLSPWAHRDTIDRTLPSAINPGPIAFSNGNSNVGIWHLDGTTHRQITFFAPHLGYLQDATRTINLPATKTYALALTVDDTYAYVYNETDTELERYTLADGVEDPIFGVTLRTVADPNVAFGAAGETENIIAMREHPDGLHLMSREGETTRYGLYEIGPAVHWYVRNGSPVTDVEVHTTWRGQGTYWDQGPIVFDTGGGGLPETDGVTDGYHLVVQSDLPVWEETGLALKVDQVAYDAHVDAYTTHAAGVTALLSGHIAAYNVHVLAYDAHVVAYEAHLLAFTAHVDNASIHGGGGGGGGGTTTWEELVLSRTVNNSVAEQAAFPTDTVIADTDILEFRFVRASGGVATYQVSGLTWNSAEIVGQSVGPTSRSGGLAWKITENNTSVATFGHGDLLIWKRAAGGIWAKIARGTNTSYNGTLAVYRLPATGGSAFTPSQENLYDAVAEIITGNITEDATAHTIDVLAAGDGATIKAALSTAGYGLVKFLTQTEYDALTTYDNDLLYSVSG